MERTFRLVERFLFGLVVDFWLAALPPEVTAAETDFLERHLALAPGARVLDVPCGQGRHAIELSARGYRVTGVDLSGELLAAARKDAAARRLPTDVTWRQGDMRDLPFPAAFDAAFCAGSSFGFLGDAGDAEVPSGRRRRRFGRAAGSTGRFEGRRNDPDRVSGAPLVRAGRPSLRGGELLRRRERTLRKPLHDHARGAEGDQARLAPDLYGLPDARDAAGGRARDRLAPRRGRRAAVRARIAPAVRGGEKAVVDLSRLPETGPDALRPGICQNAGRAGDRPKFGARGKGCALLPMRITVSDLSLRCPGAA